MNILGDKSLQKIVWQQICHCNNSHPPKKAGTKHRPVPATQLTPNLPFECPNHSTVLFYPITGFCLLLTQ